MKKFSFLALAAVGLLLGACSSNDAVDEGNNPDFNGKSEGFFKININLPTTPAVSTRAWNEETAGTLHDGLEVEYGVKTAILLLFDGADEASATLTQVVNLTPSFTNVTDNPNQITTKYEEVVKLDAAPTKKLYALAVINGKGNIEFESATSIKLRGTSTTGCKIGDLQAARAASASVSDNDFIYTESGTSYFFMTNAVLSNEKGGSTPPATAAGNQHILAPVDANFIYETEAAATSGKAAADIYVERGVAKVTIASAALGVTGLTDKTTKLSASFNGWCLDNTNTTSYVVRQVPAGTFWNLCSYSPTAATDKYRFVGENVVDKAYGTSIAGYRTYWAQDPNYSSDWAAGTFSSAAYASDATSGITDNNPKYCLENTFDVAHQTFKNTTRVIIGVKLTSDGSEFYVMGADRKTLYTLADVKNKVVTELMNTLAFSTWYAANCTGTLGGGDVTVTWSSTGAGKITVTGVTVPGGKITSGSHAGSDFTFETTTTTVDGVDFTGVIGTTLNDALANVERFVGGIAYYPIRIKHFGEDLTPWNSDEYTTKPKESGVNDIYPNDARRDANYLGRYGMVRNNWYELVIGDIVKIGKSTIPSISASTDPDHPDDELEDLYIKARINILSWAKRTQNWDLR